MSQLSVNTITNAAGGNTAQINGMTPTADSLQGFRNRIINGDMVIDQRNAGAAVTINSTANTYTLDRWTSSGQLTDGVFTVQQSTTVPTGFKNSLVATVTTADASIGATQSYLITQFIEGLNTYDFAFGTASASTVTLSFWVRSSLTGAFGGSISNSALDRVYPFSFTINSADTYEQKTVTIAGDTTGTWLTDTGRGLAVRFSLGVGSDRKTTAGAWAAGTYFAPTGSVDLIATSGATFYITGVQLEAGSVATPFERRPYGTELALCQRYYQNTYYNSVGVYSTTTGVALGCRHMVPMRAAPTVSLISGTTVTLDNWGVGETTLTPSFDQITAVGFRINGSPAATSTAGRSVMLIDNNTQASAEL